MVGAFKALVVILGTLVVKFAPLVVILDTLVVKIYILVVKVKKRKLLTFKKTPIFKRIGVS